MTQSAPNDSRAAIRSTGRVQVSARAPRNGPSGEEGCGDASRRTTRPSVLSKPRVYVERCEGRDVLALRVPPLCADDELELCAPLLVEVALRFEPDVSEP